MKKHIAILILVSLLTSCEKEANIKLPEVKSVPVIFCYISPSDTIISLKLSMSQPLFEKQNLNIYEPVNDANVTLSSAQGNTTLIYNSINACYCTSTAAYPIIAGQTYKIGVTLSDGTFAESETTVPDINIPIAAASLQTVTANNYEYLRFKIGFQDDANKTNYYRVAMSTINYFMNNDTTFSETGIRKIYSDAAKNGEFLEVNFDLYDGGQNFNTVGYNIYLLNANKDYYLLYNSLNNYQGNPFAEPSLIYTNVKGGLGVFAAYTLSKYRLNN